MPETTSNSAAEKEIWKKLEPYAQLVSSLLPRADAISVFDAEGWLRWTTESTQGPDLPAAIQELLEHARAHRNELGRRIQLDGEEFPHYLWWLRNDEGAFIAVVAVSTRKLVEGDQSTFEFVNQMVRPAMECLRRELSAQSALLSLHDSLSARDKDVDLLLKVTDTPSVTGGDKIDELKLLLQNAADHMNCALVALIVPDKNIAMMRPGKDRQVDGSLVARTHRQLLQLVTQRRESVVINRVGAGGDKLPFRILCSPVKLAGGRVSGMLALYRDKSGAEFQERDARLVEILSRRAAGSIEASYDALSGLLTRPALEQRAGAALSEDANRRAWSALYLDCDQLHVVNENFGMHVGDQVLAQLGELIRNRMPPGGLGSRISGDRAGAAAAPRGGERVRRPAAPRRRAARHAVAERAPALLRDHRRRAAGAQGRRVRARAGCRRVGLQGRQGSRPQPRRDLRRGRRQHHPPLHRHHHRGRPGHPLRPLDPARGRELPRDPAPRGRLHRLRDERLPRDAGVRRGDVRDVPRRRRLLRPVRVRDAHGTVPPDPTLSVGWVGLSHAGA
jgi:GGDEF domain-containing protein